MFDKMIQNRDIVALINSETNEKFTYGDLAQQIADIAVSLSRIGVRKGDVVTVCSEKRFEVIPTILGIICAGATYTPSDLTYGSFPLLHRIKIAKPKIMFCSKSALDAHKTTCDSAECIEHYIVYDSQEKSFGLHKTENGIREKTFESEVILFKDFVKERVVLEDFLPTPINGWEDRVFILFSSGTTGLPKGLPVTHLSFLLNMQCFVLESYKNKYILNTREWYYSYGLMYTLSCLWTGATVVYSPTNKEENILEAIQKYKIEIMQSAPSSIMELVKSTILGQYDVSSIRYIISASTPIGSDLIDALKKRLPHLKDIIQIYGMSEAGSICSEVGAPLGSKPGSCGVPGLGFIIKVVDLDTRKPLGPNQRGEICIKGPSVMKAYLNNVVPNCNDGEGFLKTGDVGFYDEDGYFFIVTRIKELIKFNDISIAPAEFEAILLQHPAVRDVGVVGASHPKHGEAPVAFVVLQPNASATEEELVTYLNSRVTFRMKLAGGVRFVELLPRGAGDKLDRQALRLMLVD